MKKRIAISLLAALLAVVCAAESESRALPESLCVFAADDIGAAVRNRLETPVLTASVDGGSAVVRLLGVLPAKTVSLKLIENKALSPGGQAFGVKFFTEGVLVVGISDVRSFGGVSCPAAEADLRKGDILLTADGAKLDSAETLRAAIEESGGETVTLELLRDGERLLARLRPALSAEENEYRAGLLVRDSTAGIGTVTYIDAESGRFAGLGHGICDGDTGALMPLRRAVVVDVDINGVRRGEEGVPGELKGAFGSFRRGTIERNTETGVYGRLDAPPETLHAPIPVGLKDELKTGKAFIYTTLRGSAPEKFSIEIEKIYRDSGSTKNFLVRVTDARLLSATGGIVQGMSGSPIVQDGKIVGAVTHVLINDPTRGYGIFIENMLSAPEVGQMRAA